MYPAVKPLQVDERPPIPGAKQTALPCSENALYDSYNSPLARPNQRRPYVARRAGGKLSAAAPRKSNDSSDDCGTAREPLLSPADLSNDKGPRLNQSINRLTLSFHLHWLRRREGAWPQLCPHFGAMARSERYFPTMCSRPLEFSQVISKSSVSGRRCTFKFPVHGLV